MRSKRAFRTNGPQLRKTAWFLSYLAVEEEVLVVEDEEDGGGARLEVLEVAALDAQGAFAAVVFELEGIVVYLRRVRSVYRYQYDDART
jgi:hypothetical protein